MSSSPKAKRTPSVGASLRLKTRHARHARTALIVGHSINSGPLGDPLPSVRETIEICNVFLISSASSAPNGELTLHHRNHAGRARFLFGRSRGVVTAQSFHLNYGNCILPTMKRTVRTYQHPLDRLLGDEDEGSPSLLEFVAREYAGEGFDAERFARELRAKLERMRYPQPNPMVSDSFFSEIL